jgi:hypothetical protein
MRTKHPRVRLLAVTLSLSALFAAAGPAQAVSPPVKVDIVGCVFSGGEATVDAGVPLLLDAGWAALTPFHELAFFVSQRTVASINGVPIRNPNRFWRLPQKSYPFPDLPWLMSWDYPVKPLAPGQSITVGYDWNLRFQVSDGVDTYPSGPVLGPLGAAPSCVVTAV